MSALLEVHSQSKRRCCSTGASARQLQQSRGTFTYPGCLPLDQSVIATNPDFSDLYLELNISGVLDILSDLQSPVTLFAFTNEAQEESVASFNHTVGQADSDPLIASAVYDGKLYTVVTEAVPVSTLASRSQLTPHAGAASLASIAHVCMYSCAQSPLHYGLASCGLSHQ